MSLIPRRTLLENTAKGGAGARRRKAARLLRRLVIAVEPDHVGGQPFEPSAGTPKHGGTLHAGLTGGSSSDTCDPNTIVNNTDYARAANLYEGLVWLNADALQYNRLAEEMTPNKDATVWTIRLRKGVTFHNGKDGHRRRPDLLDQPRHEPQVPGGGRERVERDQRQGDEEARQPHDHRPVRQAVFDLPQSLANNITVYVVPVGFDPKKPIGTGPFKLAELQPRAADRLRPQRELLELAAAVPRPGRHDRLRRRDQPGQRAARRARST